MRADRWFHTLVVVGASLSACGGHVQSPGEGEGEGGGASSGGAGASGQPNTVAGGSAGAAAQTGVGGSPVGPTVCSYQQQFTCASYEPLRDCYCDALAPLYAEACEQRLDFQCREITAFGHVDYVACYCAPRELTPDDCAVPESFSCNVTYPAFADCHCDGPVVSESDCQAGQALCCQNAEPRFGCECCSLVIK